MVFTTAKYFHLAFKILWFILQSAQAARVVTLIIVYGSHINSRIFAVCVLFINGWFTIELQLC